MSERNAPYLHLVRGTPPTSQPEHDKSVPSEREEAPANAASGASGQERIPLNAPLQQAIMYAAVSWVALVMERTAHSVDIQPVGRNLYEVSVHYADAEGQEPTTSDGIILRVRLAVEPGLALHTTVEPVRP